MNALAELREIVARLHRLLNDQRAYVAEAGHVHPRAVELLTELDSLLTEKKCVVHGALSHFRGLWTAFFEEGSYIAYLADGGYSRVVVDVWDSGKVWLTSESLDKVKANWAKLEARSNPRTRRRRNPFYDRKGHEISAAEADAQRSEMVIGDDRVGDRFSIYTYWSATPLYGSGGMYGKTGPRLLFETQVTDFDEEREYGGPSKEIRYATEEAAVAGHQKWVAWARAQLRRRGPYR